MRLNAGTVVKKPKWGRQTGFFVGAAREHGCVRELPQTTYLSRYFDENHDKPELQKTCME